MLTVSTTVGELELAGWAWLGETAEPRNPGMVNYTSRL